MDSEPLRLTTDLYRFVLDTGVNIDSLMLELNNNLSVSTAARGGIDEFGGEVYFTNQFVVDLADGSTIGDVAGFMAETGLRVSPEQLGNPDLVIVEFEQGGWHAYSDLIPAAAALAAIDYFVPVILFQITLLYSPNDTYWSTHQFYLHTAKQNLEGALDFNLADFVVIYFCDDGVVDHEDWPQPFDIVGYDYTDYDSSFSVDTNTSWHGMAVLGVAYSQLDNDTGLAGYDNEFFGVRLHQISRMIGNSISWVTNTVIAASVYGAVNAGADIISHSWGKTESCWFTHTGIANAFALAHDSGVLNVAAAGNCDIPYGSCCIGFPGNLPNVLTVGGLNNSGDRHNESSYGPALDVMGYFEVITLDQMGDNGPAYKASESAPCVSDNSYNCHSGTSLAAPQAAAIAGLVLARRPDLKNNPDLLTEILRYSTDDGGTPCEIDSSFSYSLGYGRLDAFRALHAVSRGDLDNDAQITIADVVYLNDYMFTGGPEPVPDLMLADVQCDCAVDISDLVWLVDHVFLSGPPPVICFKYPD